MITTMGCKVCGFSVDHHVHQVKTAFRHHEFVAGTHDRDNDSPLDGVREYHEYIDKHNLRDTYQNRKLWIAAWNTSWDKALDAATGVVVRTMDKLLEQVKGEVKVPENSLDN